MLSMTFPPFFTETLSQRTDRRISASGSMEQFSSITAQSSIFADGSTRQPDARAKGSSASSLFAPYSSSGFPCPASNALPRKGVDRFARTDEVAVAIDDVGISFTGDVAQEFRVHDMDAGEAQGLFKIGDPQVIARLIKV